MDSTAGQYNLRSLGPQPSTQSSHAITGVEPQCNTVPHGVLVVVFLRGNKVHHLHLQLTAVNSEYGLLVSVVGKLPSSSSRLTAQQGSTTPDR